jgi:hypothetical protein
VPVNVSGIAFCFYAAHFRHVGGAAFFRDRVATWGTPRSFLAVAVDTNLIFVTPGEFTVRVCMVCSTQTRIPLLNEDCEMFVMMTRETEGCNMPTNTETSAADYAVGNKRPPKHRQFQPGRSGNPSGRPKGSLGINANLEKELRKIVTVQRSGKPTKMTKKDVIILRLVEDSMRGDFKATAYLLRMSEQTELLARATEISEEFTMPDKAALKRIAARLNNLTADDS